MSLLYKLIKTIENGERVQRYWASIIYIQYLDTIYDSVDFDDPISTLSYYKKIFLSFSRLSDEEVNKEFEIMMEFLKLETERVPEISAEVQAHQIMRSAAEKIHVAFRESNRDSFVETSRLVRGAIFEAEAGLLRLALICLREHLKTLS
jgi:hypothetical protein